MPLSTTSLGLKKGHGLKKILAFSFSEFIKLFLASTALIQFWAAIIFITALPTPESAYETALFTGIGGYVILAALVESLLFVVLLLMISFFIPRNWEQKTRFSVLAAISFSFLLWSAIGHLSNNISLPQNDFMLWVGINLSNTLLYRRIAFAGVYLLIALLQIFILWLAGRPKIQNVIAEVVERLGMLAYIYLFLDLLAVIYLIPRLFS